MMVLPGNCLAKARLRTSFATILLYPLRITARSNDRVYCSLFLTVWYFSNLVLTFQKKGLWGNQKLINFTKNSLHFWPSGCRNRSRLWVGKDTNAVSLNQEPRYQSTGKLYHSFFQWIVFMQILCFTNQNNTSETPSNFLGLYGKKLWV